MAFLIEDIALIIVFIIAVLGLIFLMFIFIIYLIGWVLEKEKETRGKLERSEI
jgi:cytochrome oxidase assembly protein ShyY1